MMTLHDFDQTNLSTFELRNEAATLRLFQNGLAWEWETETDEGLTGSETDFCTAEGALEDLLTSGDAEGALALFTQEQDQ